MRLLRTVLLTAMAMLALTASASANIPSTSNLTLPITVPSMNGWSDGTAMMTVAYTDSDATATVTAPSVGLGVGKYFRIDTCLKRHVLYSSYETKCNQTFVDTRTQPATIFVAAPTLQLKSPRPSTNTSGYFSFGVYIYVRQADGSYSQMASSWPGSVQKASVAIPPKGLTTGSAVSSEGAPLSSGMTGGMNSTAPDSFCGADSRGLRNPTPADLSTTALGTGPAYYEVGEPTGNYAGQAPKGVMLVIHGGGWSVVGPQNVEAIRSEADRWRARGWRTVSLTYRACSQSIADVEWFYDQARATWGTSLPYCATGQSAGAHLALLLAASRSTLSCAIAEAGPADMTSLKSQTAAGTDGAAKLYNMMAAAFGGDDQAIWWSPAQWKINARVLWADADNDPLIPEAQGDLLRTKMLANDPNAYIDVEHLAAGSVWWVHSAVTQDSLDSFYAAEEQLVAPLVGP